MIRAGRVFARLSQDQLADRAGIHRDSLRAWEGSSDSVPRADSKSRLSICESDEVLVMSLLQPSCGPGNSTTTESNSACNEALMIG
jgi:transcriptional regulator with XRE-family HTH domain